MNIYLNVFTTKKMAILLLLGFSSGFPLALTFGTLQAMFKDAGLSLFEIGAVTLIGLPYTIKFFWAPLLDRFTPPFLGRRRGWLVITQISLMAAIFLMAQFNPVTELTPLVGAAILVAFLSATQDIVADGYRSDILNSEELGAGAAVFVLGYRLGMLVSGAFALFLSDHFPWPTVYMLMAPFMLFGVVAVFWSSPELFVTPPHTLTEAVILPFRAFFHEKGGGEAVILLTLILLYKFPDALAGAMTTPFLMDIGFSKTEIGVVNKGLGLFCTIFGGLLGGAILAGIGLYRSLWIYGILQGVSNLVFTGLAYSGASSFGLFLAVGIENLSGGMATTAFVALLMHLTERRYSATQYALFSSLSAITPRVIGPVSGYLAEVLNWPVFYGASAFGMLPGLALLWWLYRHPTLFAAKP